MGCIRSTVYVFLSILSSFTASSQRKNPYKCEKCIFFDNPHVWSPSCPKCQYLHIFLSFIDIIAYNDTIVNFQSFHAKSSSSTHHLILGKKKSTYPSRMNGAISSIVYCPGFFQVTFYPVSASFCTQIKHIRSTIFIQIASSVLFQTYSFGALRINSIENRFHYRNPIVEVNVPCVKIHWKNLVIDFLYGCSRSLAYNSLWQSNNIMSIIIVSIWLFVKFPGISRYSRNKGNKETPRKTRSVPQVISPLFSVSDLVLWK